MFWPVPNVDSVLVGFDRGEQPGTEAERLATFALVDAAFQQRRKMLRQSLSSVLGGSASASDARSRRPASTRPRAASSCTVDDFLRDRPRRGRAGRGLALACRCPRRAFHGRRAPSASSRRHYR